MKTNLKQTKRVNSGFSLVEIVVAVGIVATVMVALLGMIPTGLNTVNEAADTMAEIRIAQQLISEVQMTDWDDIDTKWNQSDYYFDGEGNKLIVQDNKVRYTCRIEIGDEPFNLPAVPLGTEYMKRITVKVSNKRGGGIDFSDNATKKDYRSFSSVNVMTGATRDVLGL
jgi:uncharacterized protein (TIGR02598 family)